MTETDPKEEFRKQYISLRTVLDSLQDTGLRYCLSTQDPEQRIARAQELEKLVIPVIEEIASRYGSTSGAEGCGDGWSLCNGVCVPYDCPEW